MAIGGGRKLEEWLKPWNDAFFAHNQLIREARKTKDTQKILQAIDENLPQMIAIRNEVHGLPLPGGYEPKLFGMIGNFITGVKTDQRLEIHREVALESYNEVIRDSQRELRKFAPTRR